MFALLLQSPLHVLLFAEMEFFFLIMEVKANLFGTYIYVSNVLINILKDDLLI